MITGDKCSKIIKYKISTYYLQTAPVRHVHDYYSNNRIFVIIIAEIYKSRAIGFDR